LKTDKMHNRKKGSAKFVPDIISLIGIKDVFKIENKCRLRIKENEPTPSKNIN